MNDITKLVPGDEVIVEAEHNQVRVIGKVVNLIKRGRHTNISVEFSSHRREFRADGMATTGSVLRLIACTPENKRMVQQEIEMRQIAMMLDRVKWIDQSFATLRAVKAAFDAAKRA